MRPRGRTESLYNVKIYIIHEVCRTYQIMIIIFLMSNNVIKNRSALCEFIMIIDNGHRHCATRTHSFAAEKDVSHDNT